MTLTMANGYSSESTEQELSNEYKHDRVQISFIFCLLFFALDESLDEQPTLNSRRK